MISIFQSTHTINPHSLSFPLEVSFKRLLSPNGIDMILRIMPSL